ncbi:MAG: hypothetical protein M3322_08550, partial [Actinomycetota bacterium]|nr:hypothetical protein [Actinomycetota bacterium]
MEIASSTLADVGTPPGTTTATDIAGGLPNQIMATVTGRIPLLQNFGELGLGDSITMPTDWPRLAQAMATARAADNPNPAA